MSDRDDANISIDDDSDDSNDISAPIQGNEEPCAIQRSTKTRGATSMKKIRDSQKPCTIRRCPVTGRPRGPLSEKYSSWVGLEARTRISILESDWRYVDQDEKDRLWAAIKQKWNLEDDSLKKTTMSIASGSLRSFRSMLVHDYMNKNKTPFEQYSYIKPDTWAKFIKEKSTPEFEALSKINSEHAKMNDNPHHLGSRGYLGKEDLWAKGQELGLLPEIEKDKRFSQGDWDPGVAIDPLEAVLGPEHPGRTRGVGHNVGLRVGLGLENKRRKLLKKENKEERIHKLEQLVKELLARDSRNNASPPTSSGVNKSSAGSIAYDPQIQSMQDVTSCDLVFRCGGSKIVVAKGLAFPLSVDVIHGCHLEEGFMKVQVDRVMDGCEEYDLPVPIPDSDVQKLGQAIGNFIQWEIRSVATINKSVTSAPPMSEPIPPPIQKEDATHSKKVVTTTTKVPSTTPIHHQVQNDDEAQSKRVGTAFEPHRQKQIAKKTKMLPKSMPKSMQDRPTAMKELFQRLHSKKDWVRLGVVAEIEEGVFGPTRVRVDIGYDDLKDLMTNGWLDQNIITWFLADLHMIISRNTRNNCVFLAPGTLNDVEIDWSDVFVKDSILAAMKHHTEKEYFLAPYLQGGHYSLLVIRPKRRLVYVLDSIMGEKTAETYMIKNVLDRAITEYNRDIGSCQVNMSAQITWKLQKDTWTTTKPFTITQIEEMACNIAGTFTLNRMTNGRIW
ncbi:hypothetical protein OSB04_un000560 [Centaurea solstitialis]|uniref:DUF8039 domain-containing protein n=1 Tax=Centaurea solstitialis TaxID=347529 RepID=A0AA38SHG2_9ASTR|nr:hypothetical protein OSB04_un000560 [Centaurea solstitialis]